MLKFRSARSRYKYHIDQLEDGWITGWVRDETSKLPCRVEFRTPELKLVAEGSADIPRADIGDRRCGFRLRLIPGFVGMLPVRLLMFVNGVKLANNHVVLAVQGEVLDKIVDLRVAALMSIEVERLEREAERLRVRVAELERSLGAGSAHAS